MEARDSFCFPKNTKNPNPSPIGKKFGFCCCGAPPGTRTLGPLIKSQLLYQLSQRCILSECGFFILIIKSRRLPIFTSRFQLTIFGTSELNFCVRNGNRWDLTVIDTDQSDWLSIAYLLYFVQCFLKDVPSKLNNHCLHFVIDLRIQANCGQALDLLVHAC